MFIEETETDLLARLQQLEAQAISDANLEVELLPDNETAFRRPTTKGRISVVFFESKYGDSVSIDLVNQPVRNSFAVFVMAKSQRGNFGVHDLYKRACKALIGYSPVKHETRLSAEGKYELWMRESNLWVYRFQICADTMLRQAVEPDTEYGILNHLEFQSPPGDAAQPIDVGPEPES